MLLSHKRQINHYVEILISTQVRMYDHFPYTQIIIKNIFLFFSPSVRMINLSLNELKLIAESRNFIDYKNKSENDLFKILSEQKPKINLSKKKTKEVKKDFSEL